MPQSTYSRNNGIELIPTGEKAGIWGTATNDNFNLIDDAIDGTVEITLGSDTYTITVSEGAPVTEGRKKVLHFRGTIGNDCNINFTPLDMQKYYFVINETDGGKAIIFRQGQGSVYRLENGYANVIYLDGMGDTSSCYGILAKMQFQSLRVDIPAAAVPPYDEIQLNGKTKITGSLTTTGNTTVGGTLAVTGASTLTGNVTMAGTLNVTGALTGTSASLSTTLTVSGATTLNGSLGVFGGTTFYAAVHASSTLRVDMGGDAVYDMYYRGATGFMARLGAAGAGAYLRSGTGGIPQWQSGEMPIGISIPGGVQGLIHFTWNNVLWHNSYLVFDAAKQYLGVGVSVPSYVLEISGAPTADNTTLCIDGRSDRGRRVLYRAAGVDRFDIGVTAELASNFYVQRYQDDGTALNSILIYRETGRILMGLATDAGGSVNMFGLGAGEPALAVRNHPAQVGPIQIWKSNAGTQVASVENDGSYTGKLSLTSVLLNKIGRLTPQAAGPIDVNKGALMFCGDIGVYNSTQYLAFRYGTGNSYASVFLMLPPLGAGGQSTGLTWSANYATTSVQIFATREGQEPPSFEEAQAASDAQIVDRILSRPNLVARLREALR